MSNRVFSIIVRMITAVLCSAVFFYTLEAVDVLGAEGAEAVTTVDRSTSEDDEVAVADEETLLPSKEDLIAQRISDATPPEDLPEGLEFKYNKAMCLTVTDAELEILERIVEAEAGNQDVYGRILVANVVINRVNAREFPNDIESVVFQSSKNSRQFSPTRPGGRYYTETVTKKTKLAVERALRGEDYSKGAIYFFQRSAAKEENIMWFDNELTFLLKYGCHEFFIEE